MLHSQDFGRVGRRNLTTNFLTRALVVQKMAKIAVQAQRLLAFSKAPSGDVSRMEAMAHSESLLAERLCRKLSICFAQLIRQMLPTKAF